MTCTTLTSDGTPGVSPVRMRLVFTGWTREAARVGASARTWPLVHLTIPLEGLSKQIDRLSEGYCFQILATNRNPKAHNGRVLQTATHLT